VSIPHYSCFFSPFYQILFVEAVIFNSISVAKSIIRLNIVQQPTKPRNVKVLEVIGTSVQLEWDVPKDNGNTEIIGYQIEKRDRKSGADSHWYIVHERVRKKLGKMVDSDCFKFGPMRILMSSHFFFFFLSLKFFIVNGNDISWPDIYSRR
jgi:hypothetical protein